MPELPEVETVVRSLAKTLTGRVIRDVEVLHKPSVSGSPSKPQFVKGKRVLSVHRRGKFIRIDLEDSTAMAIHLRMTGWLGVIPTGAKDPRNDPYVRVRYPLDDGKETLIFRDVRTFGRVWCGARDMVESMKALARLGPEPLIIKADEFAERLKSRSGRLKPLLLNQEFLAGVGNIYADESLFRAGLHPLALSTQLKTAKAHALHAAIQEVLAEAIQAGGSSVENFLNPDGEPGWFQQKLRAYGREGEKCMRCDGIIQRIVLGQRGTWFCPKCQKKR